MESYVQRWKREQAEKVKESVSAKKETVKESVKVKESVGGKNNEQNAGSEG